MNSISTCIMLRAIQYVKSTISLFICTERVCSYFSIFSYSSQTRRVQTRISCHDMCAYIFAWNTTTHTADDSISSVRGKSKNCDLCVLNPNKCMSLWVGLSCLFCDWFNSLIHMCVCVCGSVCECVIHAMRRSISLSPSIICNSNAFATKWRTRRDIYDCVYWTRLWFHFYNLREIVIRWGCVMLLRQNICIDRGFAI